MGRLEGIYTALITPFNRRGQLHLAALPELLARQQAAGITGVVIGGTNGEATSMSVAERQRLLDAAMEHRGALRVIAGAGAASVVDAVELTRHASGLEVDGLLVLPPFYYKNVPAAGLAAYFGAVLDASQVPVLLYSIPQFSAVPITDELLALLKGHPHLAGVKDSAGEWDRTRALIEGYRELTVFPGNDGLLAQALAAGARGSISGTANAFPELLVAVKWAHDAGEDTAAPQARVQEARLLLQRYPAFAVNKTVLAIRGGPRLWVRPPLMDLSVAQESALRAELANAGLL